ncbi:MAG: sigma-54 dependent transcriptional regulator, partial [Patescibacteria group bacterium]
GKLKDVLVKALEAENLMDETISFAEMSPKDASKVRAIIGMSAPMQTIYKTIGQVASSNVPVLVTGESGTGKELVARAIYNYSARKDQPFLAINCSAIPDTLLESELFGYEKGAFTGAAERRIGKFEQCDGGTIFLDEIGDMAGITQAKILRVLQEGEFERVGGTDTIKVNVRIISATNRDLAQSIKDGKFREDLYYRLNVVNIQIPPLRERISDVADLVKYFLQKFNAEMNKSISEIPQKAMDGFQAYTWPGNVRELENTIKRAVVMSTGKTLYYENLSATNSTVKALSELENRTELNYNELLQLTQEQILEKTFSLQDNDPNKENLLGRIEEVLIKKTLERFRGNQVRTAKLLGITRNTLRTRIEQFGLK